VGITVEDVLSELGNIDIRDYQVVSRSKVGMDVSVMTSREELLNIPVIV